MTRSVLIDARDMHLGYRRHQVFRGVSFTIPAGRVGLLGPNGAGKSTLMEAIVTLRRPSAGRLVVLGHDVGSAEGRVALRAESAFLPQQLVYHPGFTVREHVDYCGWLKGVDRHRLASDSLEVIDAVGLASSGGRKLGSLSGGMLRRAAIAGTLVSRPRLVVLDEPTAGLDPEQRMAFRSILENLSENTSVLLATHLVEDVVATCTDVVVLAGGEVRLSGSISELAAPAAGVAPSAGDLEARYVSVLTGRAGAGPAEHMDA